MIYSLHLRSVGLEACTLYVYSICCGRAVESWSQTSRGLGDNWARSIRGEWRRPDPSEYDWVQRSHRGAALLLREML